MGPLNEILLTSKRCYKNSIVNGCDDIQDDLLSTIVIMENYLNNAPTTKKHRSTTRRNISNEKYRDMAYIAYVLSEFGHSAFDNNKTQAQVINSLANILNVKTTTLRMTRDYLDSYTNSDRKGWKVPLNERLQHVFDECTVIVPPENVIVMAKNILNKYEKEGK